MPTERDGPCGCHLEAGDQMLPQLSLSLDTLDPVKPVASGLTCGGWKWGGVSRGGEALFTPKSIRGKSK